MMDYKERDPDNIKYPDSKAKILRNTHWLSQLDGDGWNQLQTQMMLQQKNQQQDLLFRGMAGALGIDLNELKKTQLETWV